MEILNVDSIIKRSIRGIFTLISRTFILNIISFVSFMVITSALAASEIGIYVAVIAIQRVISFFTDFGLGAALVQKKEELKQEDITTTFTVQALITFLIFIIVFVFLGKFAILFRLNAEAQRLLLVLVFTIFLSSFKTIPSILLERSLKFGKLVLPQIAESLVFNGIVVILVLKSYGIASFSWAFLISSLIGIPFYYLVSPWKIRIGINRKSLNHLKYGMQFQAKNILGTIKDDLLTVILIRFLSFTQIGYIGFAQRLAFYAYRFVVDSVTKVTFSAYSRAQHDLAFLKQAIEKSLFFVSASMFPILFGLIVVSPYLIKFYPNWHNKWEPAAFSIVFFCLNAAVSSLSGILVNVLDATGRVKVTLRLMVMWTVLIWILTPLLIYLYGYNGVSVASFLVTTTIFYTVFLVKKIVEFKFISSIAKPLISTLLMTIVVYILSNLFAKDLLSLVFVILTGGIAYSVCLLVLSGKELKADLVRFGIKI
ncbi:MAG: oligosaccharide flippase family protein [Candidatus Levybacteria bacterium]|nr:oligosaccharide flippase family protein [Candidatus Levybacteria bacterium]